LQAAVGEQVAGGVLVGGEGGRPVYWDSPQATPDGVSFDTWHLAFADGRSLLNAQSIVQCILAVSTACMMQQQ